VLAVDSGLRQGELLALQWNDLDLERATVRVCKSLEEVGGTLNLKQPKTKSASRSVSLSDTTVLALTAHRKANLFAPHLYRHVVSAVRVMTSENGIVVARSNYAVFRTSTDPMAFGTTDVYAVGEYRDRIAVIDGALKFQEKIVILDTSRVQSLLVTPL
jgi:integrase